jgi:hypothetical protein
MMYKVAMMRGAEADMGGNAEMGFSGGLIKYNASVNAEFDLIAP